MKILETAGLVLLSQSVMLLGLTVASMSRNVVKITSTKTMEKPLEATERRIRDFQFRDRISFRTQTQVVKTQVLSVLGNDKNVLDFTATPSKDTVRYQFYISSILSKVCSRQTSTVCVPQAQIPFVPGNLAALTLDINGKMLKPGVYRFRSKQANAIQDLSFLSPYLYSDPFYAQWGCARWGEASFTVKTVQYGLDRRIKGLQVSLSQICEQTTDLPIPLPQDPKPSKPVEPAQTYTYYASLKF